MMPYLSCKKIENDVYNFPTWQYCKYKDIFDSRIIINSTAKFYISISYQKDLLSIDTRIFTPSIPAVFVFLGTDGMASGPSLIFISLPKVFASMGAIGRIIAIAFFLMMGFAALTSCVSVMETLVANCMEIFHKSRQKMCAVIGIYSLVTAVLICLGYNVLYFEVKLPNGTVAQLLDIMDYISNSFLMPFISLLTSILIGWVVGPKLIIDEVERNGEHFKRAKLYCFMIRYAVPIVMLILFLVSTGIV